MVKRSSFARRMREKSAAAKPVRMMPSQSRHLQLLRNAMTARSQALDTATSDRPESRGGSKFRGKTLERSRADTGALRCRQCVSSRRFPRGRRRTGHLWSAHPDDTCGRDRPFAGGAEGATGPGNSQANGPQEDGSLESGDWPSGRAPTDEVSRHSCRRIFQVSGQRGSRAAQLLRRRTRLNGDLIERQSCRPPRAYTALRPASPARCPPGAVRRLRDAGPVSHRHPRRACAHA